MEVAMIFLLKVSLVAYMNNLIIVGGVKEAR